MVKNKQIENFKMHGGLSEISKEGNAKYIHFIKAKKQNPSTEIWLVRANYNSIMLGTIKWYAQWRQYGFYPEPNTVFERVCLDDIKNFVIDLNKKFHEKRKRNNNK